MRVGPRGVKSYTILSPEARSSRSSRTALPESASSVIPAESDDAMGCDSRRNAILLTQLEDACTSTESQHTRAVTATRAGAAAVDEERAKSQIAVNT